MIRARDFLLYILIFTFVVLGIFFTLSQDRDTSTDTESEPNVVLSSTDGDEIHARENRAEDIDRRANIAALQEKIANGEGLISQGEPVFTSVDTPTSTENPEQNDVNQDAIVATSDRTAEYCVTQNNFSTSVNILNRNAGEFSISEGARILSADTVVDIVVGSSSVSTTTKKAVLQLPQNPIRGLASNCLDSEVIGIALDGTVIKNNETWKFRGAASSTLIGYSRDGIGIHGAGVDETLLDSCGGYDTGSGYQYHLREKELFILGCFAASPSVFEE
ncbi:MAG: hypothetical protein ACI9VM_000365 [Candidatus Azotimanducaceae bacterium]|jgi:hypothetical protein